MSIRLLHAADLHLDAVLTGAAEGPWADATLKAFSRIVDTAIAERVDAVLLAGDLYERRDQSIRARLHCAAELKRLHQAEIASFIVRGNHDPLDADAGGLSLPPSCTVFGGQWSEVPVMMGGGVGFRVQGVSFREAIERDNLAQAFKRQGPEPTIGLLHCNLVGTRGHANYAPCSLDDLSAAGLDYWALGHVHTRQQFELASGGLAAYPGNPQGRTVKETGPRGALLVELDETAQARPTVRFVPLDVVRWHELEVDLSTLDSLDALVDEAVATVQAVAANDPARAHAVRLVIVGRGALHAQLGGVEALEALRSAVAERLKSLKVLLERVVNASAPAVDLEVARREGGVPALVAAWVGAPANRVDELWAAAEDLTALEARLAKLGVPGLSDREALVRQAAALAVAALQER